jgi:pimeloyl-ACP methyl ester carboxylesterase
MVESGHTLLRLADGRTLEVSVSGPENGPVLLYHQGTPGDTLLAYRAAAHRMGLRFVTTWRPGYAESTRLPGRNVAHVVSDSEAVLDFLGVERCVVSGCSGGGPHTLACGALLADRVAAMTVFASVAPYGVEGLDWTAGRSPRDVEQINLSLQGEEAYRPEFEPDRAKLLLATAADLVAQYSTGADGVVVTEKVAEDFLASFHESLRYGSDGWLDDELSWVKPWGFDVSAIRVPTSLWQGTEDALLRHGEWLAAHIPGVVTHIEQGDGHISINLSHIDESLQELMAMSSGRL